MVVLASRRGMARRPRIGAFILEGRWVGRWSGDAGRPQGRRDVAAVPGGRRRGAAGRGGRHGQRRDGCRRRRALQPGAKGGGAAGQAGHAILMVAGLAAIGLVARRRLGRFVMPERIMPRAGAAAACPPCGVPAMAAWRIGATGRASSASASRAMTTRLAPRETHLPIIRP